MIGSGLPSGSLLAVPFEPGFPFDIMITAQACGDDIDVPEIVLVPPFFHKEKMLTPGAAKSTGGLPKLDHEGMLSLTSIAEIVQTFLPLARAGEKLLE